MIPYFNAYAIEWLWFAFSIVALVLSIRSLVDAVKDEAFLSAAGKNGPRRLVADANVRQEIFRQTMCLVATGAALCSLFLSPPPPEYQLMPQMLISTLAWIVIASIMMFASILDRHLRRKLAQYSEEERPIDPMTGTKTAKEVGGLGVKASDGSAIEKLGNIDSNTAAIERNTQSTEVTIQELKDKV